MILAVNKTLFQFQSAVEVTPGTTLDTFTIISSSKHAFGIIEHLVSAAFAPFNTHLIQYKSCHKKTF